MGYGDMNVMYLCDNNYAWIAGISILSLLKSNMDIKQINIYLIGDCIEEDNIEKLDRTVRKFRNASLTVLPMPDMKKMLGMDVELHWWVANVFSRVFLGEVFKDYAIKRLIYIDCDTLVVGSLKELWETDLDGYIGAGVCEAMGNLHKKAIGLEKQDNYFNAGMFLVDVVKWKIEGIDEQARAFIQRHGGKLEYADESVLNGILSRKLKKISLKFNLTSLSLYFSIKEVKIYRKSSTTYTEGELKKALDDPRIIHFTSTYMDRRPWEIDSKNPYCDYWRKIKEESLWKEMSLKEDNKTFPKRVAGKCVKVFPKGIRLYLTGFIHAYIKPLKYVL